MRKVIYSVFLTVVLLSVLPVTARAQAWTDTSDLYGGFDPDSPEGNRAFWDNMSRRGGLR